MTFLEKNLEDIICESSLSALKSRGIDIRGKVKRQLRIGNYGIADLVTFERCLKNYSHRGQHDEFMKIAKEFCPKYYEARKDDFENSSSSYLKITIYELKKDLITIEVFLQAIRYVKGISRYLESRDFNSEYAFEIRLVGHSIQRGNSFPYMTDIISSEGYMMYQNGGLVNYEVYTYTYEIDGLRFHLESDYKLIEEGF